MALWLFKEEPSCFSFADLEKAGSATWDGVKNALALKNLRQVKPGDRILFYHTGKEKAVVGVAKAKSVEEGVVTIAPLKRWPKPVTLAQIKADESLQDWALVRISRLSVMPVTAKQWRRVEELAAD
ncbi:MAG: EVE domain-containing protein [Gemmataceae bacterium]